MPFNLFKVKAQTIDEVASPTIPFDPPVVGTTPTPLVGGDGPSITLTTSKVTFATGERFKVQVVIDTDGEQIDSYSFQIIYNPGILRVIDLDPSTVETQIDFRDTFFVASENSASQITGIINLTASTNAGSATITQRTVAEIEFETLVQGASEIEINQQNSSLTGDSIDILSSVNSITINVAASGQPTPTSPVFATPLPEKTPATGILDDLGLPNTIFIGALLVTAGIYLLRFRRHDPEIRR